MLSLRGVTKRYGGLTAVDSLDLEVAPGEFLGLLGPNGAGKSTLISMISGLLEPDAGEVRVDGRVMRLADRSARAVLGLVPQQVALYDDLPAQVNLEIFGSLQGLSGRRLAARIDALLEAVKLTERRRDRVKEFSGGMKRRLNLAAALLHEPRLLLCDEPTVGVDPQSRHAIFEHLRELHRGGLTVIYTTHYMEEAERLCPRVAVMDAGRIVALGTLDELLARLPHGEEIRVARVPGTMALAGRLERWGAVTVLEEAWVLAPRPGFRLSVLFADLEAAGVDARWVEVARPDLEDLFLHLTGKTLRD